MKTLARTMTMALVLGVMILAPSMANATPARAAMVGIDHSQNLHILDLFFQMLGFKSDTGSARHDSHATKGAASQTAPPTVGGSTSGTISTDGAIWGRCQLVGC